MLTKLINYIKCKLRGEYSTEQLSRYGLKVGKNFSRQNEVIIDPFHCWLVQIGDNVTLAPRVHILAHDASTKLCTGYTRIGRVTIGNNVFVGASSIILPGVIIGDNVVIGAGSVITKDIPDNSIAVGNPAKVVKKFDDYSLKQKEFFKTVPRYGKQWTAAGGINNIMKEKQCAELNDTIGFVE